MARGRLEDRLYVLLSEGAVAQTYRYRRGQEGYPDGVLEGACPAAVAIAADARAARQRRIEAEARERWRLDAWWEMQE